MPLIVFPLAGLLCETVFVVDLERGFISTDGTCEWCSTFFHVEEVRGICCLRCAFGVEAIC